MSIKIFGTLLLTEEKLLPAQSTNLSFKIADYAIQSQIGILFGGNIFPAFLRRTQQQSLTFPFELTDNPRDVNAECLFSGDGVEVSINGIRIDTGESLQERMMRVQKFLEKTLTNQLIISVTLDINALEFDEINIDVVPIKSTDFCQTMLALFEKEENWTPTVRVVITR